VNQVWTVRVLRLLHLAAMVVFIGGILACIVLGAAGYVAQPEGFLVRRQIATDLTRALIVPGMWMVLVTGMLLSWRGRYGVFRRTWVGLKQVTGVLIAVNGTFLLVPLVGRILALAQSRDIAMAAYLQAREDAFGALNPLLAITAMWLGVWRPRWGSGGRGATAS
jgi:hypothetical protein